MAREDTFADLARYYDPIMEHVDYERWRAFASALAEILPARPRHLDAGCGTGTLMKGMRKDGWRCTGIDLSGGMLRAARKRSKAYALAQADLRALPFSEGFHLVTCLFDSLNFLLDDDGFRQAIQSLAGCLLPGGVLYFDVITERMVREHFEGPAWTEHNGRFSTRWQTIYDSESRIAETVVQVNRRAPATIRERIYEPEFIKKAVAEAGLTLLDVFDVETWGAPGAKSTRVDFVAAKAPSDVMLREYADLRAYLYTMLRR